MNSRTYRIPQALSGAHEIIKLMHQLGLETDSKVGFDVAIKNYRSCYMFRNEDCNIPEEIAHKILKEVKRRTKKAELKAKLLIYRFLQYDYAGNPNQLLPQELIPDDGEYTKDSSWLPHIQWVERELKALEQETE